MIAVLVFFSFKLNIICTFVFFNFAPQMNYGPLLTYHLWRSLHFATVLSVNSPFLSSSRNYWLKK